MPDGWLLAVLTGGVWFMLIEGSGGGKSILIEFDPGVLIDEFETVGISMHRALFLLARRSISGS